MRRYLETFRQHRALVILPVVLSAVVAGWFAFGAPPSYRSTASLWVDNAPSTGTSLQPGIASTDTSLAGPSSVEQTVLGEMLYTPSFDLAVGEASSLPRFLASGEGDDGFSPSALLSRASGSISEQIESSVGYGVTSSTPGPQVLRLSYTGPSPATAQSVLGSLIHQMQSPTSQFGEDFGKAAASVYQGNLLAATTAAATARVQVAAYSHAHRSATVQNDPIYGALVKAAGLATAQLAAASSGYAPGSQEEGLVRVIDPPSLPAGPVLGTAQSVLGVIGGIFAGLLVSALAVIAMTPGGTDRWDADVPIVGRRVVPVLPVQRASAAAAPAAAVRAAHRSPLDMPLAAEPRSAAVHQAPRRMLSRALSSLPKRDRNLA